MKHGTSKSNKKARKFPDTQLISRGTPAMLGGTSEFPRGKIGYQALASLILSNI